MSLEVVVVLVSPRNPLNIGAAARALSNFGIQNYRLVRPYRVALDEARSGPGAGPILENALEFDRIEDAIADATHVVGTSSIGPREAPIPLYRLEDGVRRAKKSTGKLAILFGSEKFGLSNEDFAFCHSLWRIPARAEHGSMNLGQSVAVVLYEMIRDGAFKTEPIRRAAPAEEAVTARLTETLQQICEISGYLHPPATATSIRKLKHLVRRMHLRKVDAVALQGICRQVLWKFENPS